MENDEKKYEDVIKALKNLKEVKAPENFEADLKRRISSEKYSKEKKRFWESIFVPARLIPSLGLVAVAVVIFFVIETRKEEMNNPFLIEPRVREDVVATTNIDRIDKKKDEIVKHKSLKETKTETEKKVNESELNSADDKMLKGKEEGGRMEGLSAERDYVNDQNQPKSTVTASESTLAAGGNVTVNPSVADSVTNAVASQRLISKDELNFRQVKPSAEEQKVINQLKIQVQSTEKRNKTQK